MLYEGHKYSRVFTSSYIIHDDFNTEPSLLIHSVRLSIGVISGNPVWHSISVECWLKTAVGTRHTMADPWLVRVLWMAR